MLLGVEDTGGCSHMARAGKRLPGMKQGCASQGTLTSTAEPASSFPSSHVGVAVTPVASYVLQDQLGWLGHCQQGSHGGTQLLPKEEGMC